MPALTITSLDRLIEPSSSTSKEIASPTDRSIPFSFYPPLYTTPSPRRPSSPSSFSPSPYVLNFKTRGPVQKQLNARKESSVDASTYSSLQGQQHLADAIEDTVAEPTQFAKNAGISVNEGLTAKRFCGVLPENEVFEIELDKRDAFKKVLTQKSQDLMNEEKHSCIDFSSKTDSGTSYEHLAASPPTASSAGNEEVEFFDAPDSVIYDSACEEEACPLSGKQGRGLGGHGGRTMSRMEEEIARRIKAEETVAGWQRRWNEMAKRCSSLGLSVTFQTGENTEEDSSELSSQEVLVARLVGGAIARAVVRAEKDEEFEIVLGTKNREISRLCDKLQNLELVNREMSRRNQDVIELTQRRRRRRQRRQKLALGGFCAAFCIGTVGLVCHKFVPGSTDSSGH